MTRGWVAPVEDGAPGPALLPGPGEHLPVLVPEQLGVAGPHAAVQLLHTRLQCSPVPTRPAHLGLAEDGVLVVVVVFGEVELLLGARVPQEGRARAEQLLGAHTLASLALTAGLDTA